MSYESRLSPLAAILMVVLGATACDRPTHPAGSAASAAPSSAAAGSPFEVAAVASAGPEPKTLSGRDSGAAGSAESSVNFDADPVGAPSPFFEGVVGDWYVAEKAGARGFEVDGSRWRSGTPSANLADQAKHLYGDRYAEFLDGVKAFAFFPLSVWKRDPPPGDVRISVRFYPFGGKIDQAAGIAFAIAPDGTYLGIRANALENNLLYFRVVRGRRTVIDDIRDVPTPSNAWHALSVDIRGSHVSAEVDAKKRFDKTIDAAQGGRIGLWSKADSQVLFDDFEVKSLAGDLR